jgi:hypothetical protein
MEVGVGARACGSDTGIVAFSDSGRISDGGGGGGRRAETALLSVIT